MRNPKCEICTYEWIRGCTRRCCYILSRDALFVDSSLGSFRMSRMTEKQKGDHNIGARSRNEARQQVSYDITSAAAVLFFFLLVLSPSLNVSICPHLCTPASHIQHAGLQAPIATIPWSSQQIGTSITLRL